MAILKKAELMTTKQTNFRTVFRASSFHSSFSFCPRFLFRFDFKLLYFGFLHISTILCIFDFPTKLPSFEPPPRPVPPPQPVPPPITFPNSKEKEGKYIE